MGIEKNMMKSRTFIALLPMGLFALLGFFFWRGLALNPAMLPSARLGQPLPSFSLPEFSDSQHIISSDDFIGHSRMLHVWASWCDTCAREQVFLLKLADEGLPIYGLNYKDNKAEAERWLGAWGNPFQAIAVDADGRVGIALGVYGTPETFLIDKAGIIRYRHVGALTQSVWEHTIKPEWEALS